MHVLWSESGMATTYVVASDKEEICRCTYLQSAEKVRQPFLAYGEPLVLLDPKAY